MSKTRNAIVLLLLIISTNLKSHSQNVIYKGDIQYPATNTWNFEQNNSYSMYGLSVSIGKDGNGAILMLQTESIGGSYIGGSVYVFLSNGNRITCFDKNIKDKVDGKSIALYKFSEAEVEKLKTYDITSIRFTTRGGPFDGDRTASNYNSMSSFEINRYETSKEISQLFSDPE